MIKRLIVLLLSIGCLSTLNGCEEQDCTFDISASETPHIIKDARIFYPCGIVNMSSLHATTLTSGNLGSKEDMYWLAESIAAAGMVAIAVSAENHHTIDGYGTAHKSGVAILQDENTDTSSPLFGKIDSYGVMGYSKGGAASLNAGTDLGDKIKTCIALAPWRPAPGVGHRAATLILTGTADNIATPAMGENAYDSLSFLDDRGYASMAGKGHSFWTDNFQPGSADDYIIAWLKYFGQGDSLSGFILENPGTDMTDVRLDAPPLNLRETGGCQ